MWNVSQRRRSCAVPGSPDGCCLRLRPSNTWLLPLVGAALVGDLLWFAYGRNAQCDPALYYPRIPVLEEVAKAAPGRVLGFRCLPPQLGTIYGTRDIRGYDAVDPARMVELLRTSADPTAQVNEYATTQWLVPKATVTPEGDVRLPPVLDMLGVRYVIFRGSPPPNARPVFQGPDYWVLENSNALARAFVPRRVEVAEESKARLEKLASPQFDPREVAYVEEPVQSAWPVSGPSGHRQRDSDPCDRGFAHGNAGARRPGGPMGQRMACIFERQARAHPARQPRGPRRGRARGLRERWSSVMLRLVLLGA